MSPRFEHAGDVACPHPSHFYCVDCHACDCTRCGVRIPETEVCLTLGYVCAQCIKQGKYWRDGKDRD